MRYDATICWSSMSSRISKNSKLFNRIDSTKSVQNVSADKSRTTKPYLFDFQVLQEQSERLEKEHAKHDALLLRAKNQSEKVRVAQQKSTWVQKMLLGEGIMYIVYSM